MYIKFSPENVRLPGFFTTKINNHCNLIRCTCEMEKYNYDSNK